MATSAEVVFMLDVDNTLLDNDRFIADLTMRLDGDFGKPERERYWQIHDERRDRLGYADYLGALQEFRLSSSEEPGLLQMSGFLLEYPFVELLYPGSVAAVEHLGKIGTTIILSDGDIVFQPRKIQRSGLWDTVDGRVLVYLHKERMLDAMQQRFPAKHYVMVDDKAYLLAAAKRLLGDRLTTVFVRQGHYAAGSTGADIAPAPDVTVEHIDQLLDFSLPEFGVAAHHELQPRPASPEHQ